MLSWCYGNMSNSGGEIKEELDGGITMSEESVIAIESRVKDIIVDVLRVKYEQLTPTTHLMKDLGADSLDALDVALLVEKTFDMKIPDESIRNYLTVADIVNGIKEYAASRLKERENAVKVNQNEVVNVG
jgi:acyl carrier protein